MIKNSVSIAPNKKCIAMDGGVIMQFKICYQVLFLLLLAATLNACDNSANESKKFNEKTSNKICLQTKVKNEFIVQWKNGTTSKINGLTQEKFIKEFIPKNFDLIETAEPNYELNIENNLVSLSNSCPRGNWAINNINVEMFWENNLTGKDVVIAVSDSGIDISHPALKNRIAYNEGELGLDSEGNDKSTNNIDDDDNGYVDDYYGYDFFSNDSIPNDNSGHGTAVSSLIVAEHEAFADALGKKQNFFGIAPKAKIIPIKFIDRVAGDTQSALNSLKYAMARKADIINTSWGGNDCSTILTSYIRSLEKQNVLIVAASGNNGWDLDNLGARPPVYPASLNLKNQITVGSIGYFNNRSSFSNYGNNSVELFAPGSKINVLAPGNKSACVDGTSFAAPIVSGALALLKEAYPEANNFEIKKLLLDNVRQDPNYINLTNGTLDLSQLLPKL